ncbi:PLP-dependent aminotransferase family protein [Candidatus Marinarcus aquaticus]|uniref:Aminotransferase class I n=1 Tax=Candidatus Marinarcus aquaticus TaxID=2044504 RepID=A0A4Q0XSM7_9BACT|nr:PLP-dependent aminotransferase family protein [Candidatus Marinarcus aquaticus]RXJ60322.1 aminotransferase class I [Candidatus Marinarcus aquaticus]
MKRSFIREILESIDEETISFAGGLPNEALFPLKDIEKSAMNVLQNSKVLQYSLSNGLKSLREKIAQYYNDEGFETSADNILITTGSQQAMFIIAKYFEQKSITIEEPSYLGAMNIFRMNKLDMKPVALEADGIDIKAFQKSLEETKLAYLIPDFQNPYSSTYSQVKRNTVAYLIKENDAYLIEDSPYSELFFTSKKRTISSMIPNNSFHLGSFSKTFAPSLRIGWVRANEELIHELMKIKESIDLHSCGLSQAILNDYLSDSQLFKQHLQTIRNDYKDKMEYFSSCLKAILPEFKFKQPKGGMFIYGYIENVDTKKLVFEALKHKVVFVPGSEFYLDKSSCNEIRFNFTHSTKEEVKEGLIRLKRLIKGEL